ncbi:MAG: type II toxin-antitoxin system death-on-curing family toxin [Actinomycetota bacterium]
MGRSWTVSPSEVRDAVRGADCRRGSDWDRSAYSCTGYPVGAARLCAARSPSWLGEVEFYPAFADKAALLVVRLTRNHPLPDGNKRLGWQALTMFCALNGHRLEVPAEEAVDTMLAIAAGELGEVAVAAWLSRRLGLPAA